MDTRAGQTFAYAGAINTNDCSSNTNAFEYYRFYITATLGNLDLVELDEIQMFDYNYSFQDPSFVWVQVPQLASNGCIWAYWGNSAATNMSACITNGSTWDTSFAGVWHLSEANATNPAIDSTRFKNNAMVTGSPALGFGEIAGGRAMTGVEKFDAAGINIANKAFTVEAWVNSSNIWTSGDNMWAGGGTTATDHGLECGFRYPNMFFGLISDDLQGSVDRSGDRSSWHHYAIVMNGSHVKTMYRDGVLEPSSGPSSSFYLSSGFTLGVTAGGATSFKGTLDEARVTAGVARSPNWIWASFMTVASNTTFTTFERLLRYGSGTVITIQ